VVDDATAPPPPPAVRSADPVVRPGDDGAASPAPAAGDDVEDLADFDAENLEVAEIDNSAEARLLQAFPGAEEVV